MLSSVESVEQSSRDFSRTTSLELIKSKKLNGLLPLS